MKEFLLRLAILFAGLAIAHLGVSFFLMANLGADPFNVLIQGSYRTLQKLLSADLLTHGSVHLVFSFLIIIVLLFTDRSYVRAGTLICMFCGGPIIDFFSWILFPVLAPLMNMPFRITINIIGCAILAYGMTIVIKSQAGTGPNDLVALVISEKLKRRFAPVRIAVDVVFALSGFLLGGTIGIGTLICAFVVGPVAGVFMTYNQRLIEDLIKRLCAKNSKDKGTSHL
ncbi:MAG: YitT family protein [Succinivibrio sp.]